jgi:hypothetical protein
MSVEDPSNRGLVTFLQPDDHVEHPRRRTHRHRPGVPTAEPASPEQPVEVHHVVGVLVGHNHRIHTVGHRRVQQGEQPRQRSVTEIEDHPIAGVLDDEAAARPPSLRPSTTTTEDNQATAHPSVSQASPKFDGGAANTDAVALAMGSAGHAVVFSGLTAAVSLLALLVVPVPFLANMGVLAPSGRCARRRHHPHGSRRPLGCRHLPRQTGSVVPGAYTALAPRRFGAGGSAIVDVLGAGQPSLTAGSATITGVPGCKACFGASPG